jgi:hypothetical protein
MTTKEFYRLYAFFHNVPEKGLDRIRTDNPPPRPAHAHRRTGAPVRRSRVPAEGCREEAPGGRTASTNWARRRKWERETQERPPAKPDETKLLATLAFDGNLTTGGRSGR